MGGSADMFKENRPVGLLGQAWWHVLVTSVLGNGGRESRV